MSDTTDSEIINNAYEFVSESNDNDNYEDNYPHIKDLEKDFEEYEEFKFEPS